jgi:hypothetical protein
MIAEKVKRVNRFRFSGQTGLSHKGRVTGQQGLAVCNGGGKGGAGRCMAGHRDFARLHGLLATFGDMESAEASTREMERTALRNDAVFPLLLGTGK